MLAKPGPVQTQLALNLYAAELKHPISYRIAPDARPACFMRELRILSLEFGKDQVDQYKGFL